MLVAFGWKLFFAVCLGTTIGTCVGTYLYYEGPTLWPGSVPAVEVIPLPSAKLSDDRNDA